MGRLHPPFTEVKLLQGTREITIGAQVEVELQQVVMKSHSKAITKILACIRDRTFTNAVEFHAALDALGDLDRRDCKRFLDLMAGFGNEEDIPAELNVALGVAFGRLCGDPSPHQTYMRQYGTTLFRVAALSEISSRCKTSLSSKYRETILETVLSSLHILRSHREPAQEDNPQREHNVHIFCKACRILGHLGDATHEHDLERVLGYGLPCDAYAAASAALQEIREREGTRQIVPISAVGCEENVSEAAGAGRGHKRQAATEMPDPSLDDETNEDLDAALCESEEEALRHEQAQLHEAILRSKTDGAGRPGSIACTDNRSGLLLLTFTRYPKELRQALLSSPLAAEMSARGVDLEPDFAAGRLILAEGVTAAAVSEAREFWHVAVHTDHEVELYVTLRQSLPCAIRPKLKGRDGRFLVPEDASLFGDASEQLALGYSPSAGPHLGDDWQNLQVRYTFLHMPVNPVGSPRTTVSAPAAL